MKTKTEFLQVVNQANTIVSELGGVISRIDPTDSNVDILTRAESTIQNGINAGIEGAQTAITQAATSIIDHEIHISTINSAIQSAASLLNQANQSLHSETISGILGTIGTVESEVQEFLSNALNLDITALQEQFADIAAGVTSVGNSDLVTSLQGLIQGLFFQGNVIFELDTVQGGFLESTQEVIHETVREVTQVPVVENTEELLDDIINKTAYPPTVSDVESTLEATGELIFDFLDAVWNSGFIQNLITSHIVNWFMDWIYAPDRSSISDVSSMENAMDSLTTFPGVASHITPYVPNKVNKELKEEEGFKYIPVDNVGKAQIILPALYKENGSRLDIQFVDVRGVLRSTAVFVDNLNNVRPVYRFEESGLEYVEYAPMTIRVLDVLENSRSLLKTYEIEYPNQQYNF